MCPRQPASCAISIELSAAAWMAPPASVPFQGAARLDEARFVDLIEMYVAYFNRAPDALGLQYWASRVFDGMALSQVAKSFFVQPETQVTFPATMSTTQFVWQVYYNALGRTPDAAGLAYWVGDLDSGAQTRDAFMLAMIYGARAPSEGTRSASSPVEMQRSPSSTAVFVGLNRQRHGALILPPFPT